MKIYMLNDIAEMFRVNVRTVRRWINENKLSASKIGNQYYLLDADIKEFMENNRSSKNIDESF